MEFKSLKNIETSFRHLRLFGIVYLGVCTLLVGYSVWKAYSFAEAQRQKIYVLDEGKSLMLALSQDLEQNRPVEAREHVRRFHELFFTLAPDKSAIEGNVQRAMFLSDRSAYSHYGDLAEQGYYNRIISGNVSQRIEIDSVKCDFNTYPYDVMTYARLFIIREKSVTERSLVTHGTTIRTGSSWKGSACWRTGISECMTDKNKVCMRKMYVKIKDFIGGRLRGLCDRLTPRQRAIAVIVMASLFALVNFYMIFRAVYDIGREDIRQDVIRITPLEVPDFVPADTLSDVKIREMEEFFNQFNR